MYVAAGMIGSALIGGAFSLAGSKKYGGGGGGYDPMSMARLSLMAATRPLYQEAPPPAGYRYYGNDGTYSEMVWNPSANRYEYHARQLTPQELEEKKVIDKLRLDSANNLDITPEAMTKAFEKYTGAYRGKMMDALDTAYQDALTKIQTDAEARGWSPSAAMGKLGAENIRDRMNVERDAIMTGQELEDRYRTNNMNLLQMLYGIKDAEDARALNWANSAANITSNARQNQLAENAAKNNYAMDAWKSFWNLESGNAATQAQLGMQQAQMAQAQKNAMMQGIGNLAGSASMLLGNYFAKSPITTTAYSSPAMSYSLPSSTLSSPTTFQGLYSIGGK